MKRGRSTGNPTLAEAAWLRMVKEAGCVCCAARGYDREPGGPLAEAHHLLSGGIRRGHLHTVGLCAWHHRGVNAWGSRQCGLRAYGPSFALEPSRFRRVFGTQEELLQIQEELLQALARARAGAQAA